LSELSQDGLGELAQGRRWDKPFRALPRRPIEDLDAWQLAPRMLCGNEKPLRVSLFLSNLLCSPSQSIANALESERLSWRL
jgi:hypothetical protein